MDYWTPAIDWLFAQGHAADMVLVVMAVEGAWLVRHKHWSAGDAACRLLPGALMMLGLRAALTGAAWPLVALPVALSFPVHLADLRRRGGPKIT